MISARVPAAVRAAAAAIGTAAITAQAPATRDRAAAPEPREIIALSATVQDDANSARLDHVHALLEMPLDHLGMRVVARSLAGGEPPDLDPARVRALLLHLRGDEEIEPWVWPWLSRQPRSVKVLLVGSLDPLARTRTDEERLRRWLEGFGLRFDADATDDPAFIEVRAGRPGGYEFESRPVYERRHHGPWSVGADNRIWLTTRDTRRPSRGRTPIVTGPWGGIALQPWLLHEGGDAQERRWYVDPFALLTDALDLHGVPAPDPCVRNGRRVFLLHVDGDGFESPSSVADGAINGQVFLDRIVDRYRLPMTVSVIVAGLGDELRPAEPTPRMRIAREIFARDWVEPASHGVLHALDWRRRWHPRAAPRTVAWYDGLRGYQPDMVAEVRESIAFIDRYLVPPGKRCAVMLWTGAANPAEPALRAARELGVANLNGGVYRWDPWFDSVGFVAPLGKRVGAEYQVYCGAANENVFDGFFTTMPAAFGHVSTTIENTGSPRILKPANLYVHFYSAERPPRLATLEALIDRWAYREETAPVFASTYARAVTATRFGCEATRTAAGWRLRAFGDCPTARIDAEPRDVDFGRSRGLIGARRIGGALYLHLAGPAADVVLAADPPAHPHVEQADHDLADVVLARDRVAWVSAGAGPKLVVLAGLGAGAPLTIVTSGRTETRHADGDGRLAIRVERPGRVEVRVETP